jgi:type 1 fimbria pilin
MNRPRHILAATPLQSKAIHDRRVASPIWRGISKIVLTLYKAGFPMAMKFNLTALLACCLFGALLLPKTALAQAAGTCNYTPGNKAVTVPTITFPVNAPIGTTVSVTGTSTTTGFLGAHCSYNGINLVATAGWYGVSPLTLVPGYTDVWATNYPGLGVRIPIIINSGTSYLSTTTITALALEVQVSIGAQPGEYFVYASQYNINATNLPFQFVKTSNALVTGNVPATTLLANYYTYYQWSVVGSGVTQTLVPSGSNMFFGNYLLNPFQVVEPTPTCSLSTSSATFNMGTQPTTYFNGGAGHQYPYVTNQSLVASGSCNATTASMTFAGTADPNYPNFFANSGTAKGVALGLWKSGTPQAIPNSATPITFAAGANANFTFSAAYYQTLPTVTTGSVSATVTVTVNYQ